MQHWWRFVDGRIVWFRGSEDSAQTVAAFAPSHVDLVRAGYAAFDRGDIPAVLAIFAEDAQWYAPDELPTGGTFHGPAGSPRFSDRPPTTTNCTSSPPVSSTQANRSSSRDTTPGASRAPRSTSDSCTSGPAGGLPSGSVSTDWQAAAAVPSSLTGDPIPSFGTTHDGHHVDRPGDRLWRNRVEAIRRRTHSEARAHSAASGDMPNRVATGWPATPAAAAVVTADAGVVEADDDLLCGLRGGGNKLRHHLVRRRRGRRPRRRAPRAAAARAARPGPHLRQLRRRTPARAPPKVTRSTTDWRGSSVSTIRQRVLSQPERVRRP